MDEKHYFAGANTHKGFINYFDHVRAKHTYILKGSPGCGKSTLLNTVARHFIGMGEDVEFIHCSQDPDSLDGIILKGRDIALVDGTAPHLIDSRGDGSDKIVNLVEYLDISSDDHVKIGKLEDKKHYHIEKASKIQKRTLDYHKQIEKMYAKYIDFNVVDQRIQELLAEIEKM